jgi:hypothetical protein
MAWNGFRRTVSALCGSVAMSPGVLEAGRPRTPLIHGRRESTGRTSRTTGRTRRTAERPQLRPAAPQVPLPATGLLLAPGAAGLPLAMDATGLPLAPGAAGLLLVLGAAGLLLVLGATCSPTRSRPAGFGAGRSGVRVPRPG